MTIPATTINVRPQDAAAACDRLFGKYAQKDSPGVVVAVTHRGHPLFEARRRCGFRTQGRLTQLAVTPASRRGQRSTPGRPGVGLSVSWRSMA